MRHIGTAALAVGGMTLAQNGGHGKGGVQVKLLSQKDIIEKIDPIGNRQGSPGVFVDAEFGAQLDNVKVESNQ